MDREKVFKSLAGAIRSYEAIPGHLYQSAAESSFDTWIQFFNRSENTQNTTISYYDKGCALTMLLDLKIRFETKNRKTFDDVMRTLYYDYYKNKNRGFTDAEFREVCEKTAGCTLSEIFDVYVPTTKEVDYNKYLTYAGLELVVTETEATPEKKATKSFEIRPAGSHSPDQLKLLGSWLK
jgi:predicted metalloprotease with PDZ domain